MNPGGILNKTADTLYRRARFCYGVSLSIKCAASSIVLCFFEAIISQFRGVYLHPLLFFPLVIIICYISGFFIFIKHKPDKKELLIQADKKLGLKEKLSTAYEFREKKRNPYYEKLIKDAANSAKMVIPRKLYPISVPVKTIIFIPVLFATIFFSVINSDIDISTLTSHLYNTKEMGQTIDKYNTAFDNEVHSGSLKALSDFIDELEMLGLELQTRNISGEELENILDKLGMQVKENLKQILADIERKNYSSNDHTLMQFLDYFTSENLTAENFKDMLETVEKIRKEETESSRTALNGERKADSYEQSGDSEKTGNDRADQDKESRLMEKELNEQKSYQDYLKKLDSLQDRIPQESRDEKQKKEADGGTTRGDTEAEGDIGENGNTAETDKQDGTGNLSYGEKHDITSDSFTSGNSQKGETETGTGGSQKENNDESAFSAREGETDDIYITGNGNKGNVLEFLKQLTGYGQDENDPDAPDIKMSEYQNVAEEAIAHGEIPREYSELIKNYFLYLGLLSDNTTSDE